MNTLFTADTHFGHANIIKYCHRPFADVKAMDEALIANWNAKVKPEDIVYHLGDFCWGEGYYEADSYLCKLNGVIRFVMGNHDRALKAYFVAKAISGTTNHKHLPAEYVLNGFDSNIVLSHYAMRVWDKSHYGSWQLYGHSHGTLPDDPNKLSIDVGVDCHNYAPLTYDEIKQIMAKKTWVKPKLD